MKLFILSLLVTSTICHKATIKESSSKDKYIKGDFGKCMNEKGSAVGIQASKGVEVRFYKDEACKNSWFLRAWGSISFDKAYNYNSAMLASSEESNSDAGMAAGSDAGYVVTNNN